MPAAVLATTLDWRSMDRKTRQKHKTPRKVAIDYQHNEVHADLVMCVIYTEEH